MQPCIAGGLPSGAVTCVRWVLTYAGHVCVAFVAQNELQFYGKMEKKESVKKNEKNIWMPFLSKKDSTNPNENVCVVGVAVACCVGWLAVWLCEVEWRWRRYMSVGWRVRVACFLFIGSAYIPFFPTISLGKNGK